MVIGVPTVGWAVILLNTLRTLRAIVALETLRDPDAHDLPTISLVTPACNEAEHIEAAMKAALSCGYPRLEVVAVDDRSTDETGRILDRLAARDPRLQAVHVDACPEGWLGKLNALAQGVEAATGEWLLFMDADVSLAPSALARVIAYCRDHDLDYLTAAPTIESAGFFADACYAAMASTMTGAGRFWAVTDPDSDVVAGMGAFIIFRRAFYDRTEGLSWLRREVADDVGMGLLAKRAGGRCAVVNARNLIRIPWYSGVPEMFDKLQKNWFGIVGRFQPLRLAVITALVLWMSLSGLAVALAPASVPSAAALVAPLLMSSTGLLAARWVRLPVVPALFVGLGHLLFAAMMIYANVLGVSRGGILWRGQLYRSEDLAPHQHVRL